MKTQATQIAERCLGNLSKDTTVFDAMFLIGRLAAEVEKLDGKIQKLEEENQKNIAAINRMNGV